LNALRPVLPIVLLASGCVSARSAVAPQVEPRVPVLLVHGIDDSSRTLEPLRRHLLEVGFTELEVVDLDPNDGAVGLGVAAVQVEAGARRLQARTGAPRIDVVAFSMGALISRYWLRRMPEHVPVRRFVSISGPHHGTLTGYLRSNDGARQMRPSSPFLQDLQRDEGEWDGVQVFSFWTPLDLMILPASSSRLAGAAQQTFPVIAHPLMLRDRRVFRAIVLALTEGRLASAAWAPSWP
jgi:triacylglycerol lipase